MKPGDGTCVDILCSVSFPWDVLLFLFFLLTALCLVRISILQHSGFCRAGLRERQAGPQDYIEFKEALALRTVQTQGQPSQVLRLDNNPVSSSLSAAP